MDGFTVPVGCAIGWAGNWVAVRLAVQLRGVGVWSCHWLVCSATLTIYFRFWCRGGDAGALVLSAFGGSVRFGHGGGGPEEGC